MLVIWKVLDLEVRKLYDLFLESREKMIVSLYSFKTGVVLSIYVIYVTGKRLHQVSNHLQNAYKPNQRAMHDSRNSIQENRPAVPPSYNTAVAKKSAKKSTEVRRLQCYGCL